MDSSAVMSSEESRTIPTITGNVVGVTKVHTQRFHLNDLSRRAKICLFHAAGLPANQAALENKMDASMPLGLSNLLVCAAACFLLWNGVSNEYIFGHDRAALPDAINAFSRYFIEFLNLSYM